jgi:hypothetical protein
MPSYHQNLAQLRTLSKLTLILIQLRVELALCELHPALTLSVAHCHQLLTQLRVAVALCKLHPPLTLSVAYCHKLLIQLRVELVLCELHPSLTLSLAYCQHVPSYSLQPHPVRRGILHTIGLPQTQSNDTGKIVKHALPLVKKFTEP